mgnify:CR=1 FL=1
MHSNKDRYSFKSKLKISKNDGNWISSPTVLIETKGNKETLYDRRAEGMGGALIVNCPELTLSEWFQIESNKKLRHIFWSLCVIACFLFLLILK